jgi:hypothetical protein
MKIATMNYYKKLIICIVLFFICIMILRYVSSRKESFVQFGTYSFEKYYGRNSLKDPRYTYPVHFNKNYKNFTSNKYNYNDVYDAYYKNIQTKDNRG